MSFEWRRITQVNIPYGDGAKPTKRWFARGRSVWQGDWMHNNPRFFKYVWRIWTPEDAWEDGAVSPRQRLQVIRGWPALSTHAAMGRIKQLHEGGVQLYILSWGLKRMAEDTPWDAARVPLDRHGPDYDTDTDIPFHGHR